MKVAMVCMLNQTALTIINERSGAMNPPEKAAPIFVSAEEYAGNPGNDTGSGSAGGGAGGAGAAAGDRWTWESGNGKVCVGVPEFFLLNTSEFSDIWVSCVRNRDRNLHFKVKRLVTGYSPAMRQIREVVGRDRGGSVAVKAGGCLGRELK